MLAKCSGDRFMHSGVTLDDNYTFPIGFHGTTEIVIEMNIFLPSRSLKMFIFTCTSYMYNSSGPYFCVQTRGKGSNFMLQSKNIT